jgi:hypothetical protein
MPMRTSRSCEAALGDVGLDFYPAGSRAGAEAAIKVLAGRIRAGLLEPSAVTVWAHLKFGHDTLKLAEYAAASAATDAFREAAGLPPGERLPELDDAYDDAYDAYDAYDDAYDA